MEGAFTSLVFLLFLLIFSLAMNKNTEARTTASQKKRSYAFVANSSNDDASSSLASRPNKRNRRPFRPHPIASGLSHTAPALEGPIGAPELKVLTTKDPSVIRRWLEEHVPACSSNNQNNKPSILGFDVESIAKPPWKPERASLPDGPATIQLSTPDSCLVVQLSIMGDGSAKNAPLILRDVVNNPSIIKVGVGIDDDALELYRWSKESNQCNLWEMTSRFDIGCILPDNTPGRRIGLREVAKTILGVEIKKNKKLQMSNWGKKQLSPEQISYAARDAWVSAAVVKRLQSDNKDVFGANTLLESDFIKHQRSLKEIDERATLRKNAKVEYKALVGQTEESGEAADANRIKELKETMALYRPDYPPSFSKEDFAMPFY